MPSSPVTRGPLPPRLEIPRPPPRNPVHGLWIDEAPYSCCPVDGVRTLDANLDPLDTLTVTSYAISQLP